MYIPTPASSLRDGFVISVEDDETGMAMNLTVKGIREHASGPCDYSWRTYDEVGEFVYLMSGRASECFVVVALGDTDARVMCNLGSHEIYWDSPGECWRTVGTDSAECHPGTGDEHAPIL